MLNFLVIRQVFVIIIIVYEDIFVIFFLFIQLSINQMMLVITFVVV